MKELIEVVVGRPRPQRISMVRLRLGSTIVSRGVEPNSDFGEQVVDLEVPAQYGPTSYLLEVIGEEEKWEFQGEFRPGKRWRLFATPSIHNDIGYTDLQPNVEELNSSNIDAVVRTISRSPSYKFNLETSWLAERYLAARNPKEVLAFLQLAAGGKIGVSALYLNLLTGLCTGEELHRALYFSRGLERRHGVPMKFASQTDTPTHTWFLPTLLVGAGIEGFASGSNQIRSAFLRQGALDENSPFYWEGPDGSRLLTWVARGYAQLDALIGGDASLERLRRSLPQFLARYERESYIPDALMIYGLYTDNAEFGSGEAETIRQWNLHYEFPKIITATTSEYFRYVAEHFAARLPVFRGDGGAYWEDGAGAAQRETALNRDTQRLLPVAEMVAALATAGNRALRYPAAEFEQAWKDLLLFDEHTWGSYSAITQPARDYAARQWDLKRAYAWRAHWAALELTSRGFSRLLNGLPESRMTLLLVFNPDLWPRTGPVDIDLGVNEELIEAATGRLMETDRFEPRDGYQRCRFIARDVPGIGYRTYILRRRAERPAERRPSSADWSIDSRYYHVELDPASGALRSLRDKQLGRELADGHAPYGINQLLYVSGGESSRILVDHGELPAAQLQVFPQGSARLIENVCTPFGQRIRVQARAHNVPQIETEITVYDNLKRVDIETRLRKDEIRAKEAVYVAFPFAVPSPEIAYQIQNGWVRVDADQLPGACKEWFATQNVVVVRNQETAVAWASPDAPLVTVASLNHGRWPKRLDPDNGHLYSYLMNNYWYTNYPASQGGDFRMRYSITSGAVLKPEELARFDAETRSPLVAHLHGYRRTLRSGSRPKDPRVASGTFLDLNTEHAQISAFKAAEDGNGFILRLKETGGYDGMAEIGSSALQLSAAWLCNGLEDARSPLTITGRRVRIPLYKFGYTTVRLDLSPLKR